MKKPLLLVTSGLALILGTFIVQADDLEGVVTEINTVEQSFTVQGITFHTTTTTDYDDGLNQFTDLKVGQKVEVDFEFRDNKHYATEVELEK